MGPGFSDGSRPIRAAGLRVTIILSRLSSANAERTKSMKIVSWNVNSLSTIVNYHPWNVSRLPFKVIFSIAA